MFGFLCTCWVFTILITSSSIFFYMPYHHFFSSGQKEQVMWMELRVLCSAVMCVSCPVSYCLLANLAVFQEGS